MLLVEGLALLSIVFEFQYQLPNLLGIEIVRIELAQGLRLLRFHSHQCVNLRFQLLVLVLCHFKLRFNLIQLVIARFMKLDSHVSGFRLLKFAL